MKTHVDFVELMHGFRLECPVHSRQSSTESTLPERDAKLGMMRFKHRFPTPTIASIPLLEPGMMSPVSGSLPILQDSVVTQFESSPIFQKGNPVGCGKNIIRVQQS